MKKSVNLTNLEIRQALRRKKLCFYQLADICGVAPVTVTRWLNSNLPEEKKQELLAIIEKA